MNSGKISRPPTEPVRDGTRGAKALESRQLEDGQIGERVRALVFVVIEKTGEDGAAGFVFLAGEEVALAGNLGPFGGVDKGLVVSKVGDDVVEVAVSLGEFDAEVEEVESALFGEGGEEGGVILGGEPVIAEVPEGRPPGKDLLFGVVGQALFGEDLPARAEVADLLASDVDGTSLCGDEWRGGL